MKIAPIALADVTARLVAYAAFQNKYICYYINKMVFENCVRQCRGGRLCPPEYNKTTLKMMPDVVGVGVPTTRNIKNVI